MDDEAISRSEIASLRSQRLLTHQLRFFASTAFRIRITAPLVMAVTVGLIVFVNPCEPFVRGGAFHTGSNRQ